MCRKVLGADVKYCVELLLQEVLDARWQVRYPGRFIGPDEPGQLE